MQRSLNIKEGGKWVKYVPEPTVTYVRYDDWGYNGQGIQFATTDREIAFRKEERDDVSGYTRIRVYQDKEIVEEWAWGDADEEWWKVR